MSKYRKKPIIVEARGPILTSEYVTTIEGNKVLCPIGCYIVTDIKGFEYPCDKEIFEEIHELVV